MPTVRFRMAVPLTAVLTPAALAAPASAFPSPTTTGPDHVYDDTYAGVKKEITVRGTAHTTTVRLRVSGFPEFAEGRHLGAHAHQNACGPAPSDAGPHHQNPDAHPRTPLAFKELWLSLRIDKSGRAEAITTVPWKVGQGARSIVVHAEPTHPITGRSGAPILCTTVPFDT